VQAYTSGGVRLFGLFLLALLGLGGGLLFAFGFGITSSRRRIAGGAAWAVGAGFAAGAVAWAKAVAAKVLAIKPTSNLDMTRS